jgi:chromate transporter
MTIAPRSAWHLAWVCNRLALQGFGGILAVARHEFVEREAWLDDTEFLQLLGAAQVLPGPNVINLSLMLGEQHFGWRGVLAVLAGMLLVPGAVVLALTSVALSHLHEPTVQGALRGMGLVAAGLLLGTCWKLIGPLRRSSLGAVPAFGLAAVTLGLSALWRWPLVWVVLAVGGCGMAWAAWRQHRKVP